mmetsp:Transcript_89822/g.262550  ORF Transcript_89822/g.262550 Transcript_89822/m.262550 type:complete len:345 (+) Transcript_89822:326-1360(+)
MPLLTQHRLQRRGLREALPRLHVHVQRVGLRLRGGRAALLHPVQLRGLFVVYLQRLQVQELGQRLHVLLGVAVHAVGASRVSALQLRRIRLAHGAVDEVVRLVRGAVAAGVEAVPAGLAEAVPALRAVEGSHHLALRRRRRWYPVAHAGILYAVELTVDLGVELVAGVRLEGHLPRHGILAALVLHDLEAPLHLLGVQLPLVVHLGECLEEGLQSPDHEGLVHQLHLEDVPEDLDVLRRDQGHLALHVRLGLCLVGPEHTVDAQLDVLLRRRASAVVQQLREVVVVGMLGGGLVRLVVEVADHRAHALEGRPGLGQLNLRKALHDPLVLFIPRLVCVHVRKPLL